MPLPESDPGLEAIRLTVNGRSMHVSARPATPLLYILRNHLGLMGTRFGCGSGDCGSCMVWQDGRPTTSCQLPVGSAQESAITTVENWGGDNPAHPVQQAIAQLNAGQCGYCLSGIVMTAAALIRDEPEAGPQRIAEALDGHLCRCGAHRRIIQAVQVAASTMSCRPGSSDER